MQFQEAAVWFMGVLAIPYEEMHPWKRRVILTWAKGFEVTLATLPYVCMLMLAWLGLRGQADLGSVAAAWWCFCELLFYVYCHTRFAAIDKQRYAIPAMPVTEKVAMAEQMCDHMPDLAHDLAGWMINPTPKLNQSDVAGWLSWAFAGKPTADLSAEEREEMARIRAVFNARLPEGPPAWRDEREFLRPTLDTIDMDVRSLLALGILLALRFVVSVVLSVDGFVWHAHVPGFNYWLYTPEREEGMPILFLHGGGGGLSMYPAHFPFLVRKFPNRRIVVLDVLCVTSVPCSPMMGAPEITQYISEVLEMHGIAQVSIFAHSYGSVVAGWLLRFRSACVGRVTMVDPICFQMWDSTLIRKLVYAQPSCSFHHVLYVISRDPAFGAFLHNFNLTQFMFFPESITVPTQIFIANRDWVVDGPASFEYLVRRKAKSNIANMNVHLVDMTHGGYLLNLDHMARFSADL